MLLVGVSLISEVPAATSLEPLRWFFYAVLSSKTKRKVRAWRFLQMTKHVIPYPLSMFLMPRATEQAFRSVDNSWSKHVAAGRRFLWIESGGSHSRVHPVLVR